MTIYHKIKDCPKFCIGNECHICKDDCKCPDCWYCEAAIGVHPIKTLTESEIERGNCAICFPEEIHMGCIDCKVCGEDITCSECNGCAGCEL